MKRALIWCVGLFLLATAITSAEPAPEVAAPAPPAEELTLISTSCEPTAAPLSLLGGLPEPMPACVTCQQEKCDTMCKENRCGSGICQTLCNQHCLCFDCTNTTF